MSYELRYAALAADNGSTALVRTMQTVTGVKAPVTVTRLKPGTTYAFQVYSDWSDSPH